MLKNLWPNAAADGLFFNFLVTWYVIDLPTVLVSNALKKMEMLPQNTFTAQWCRHTGMQISLLSNIRCLECAGNSLLSPLLFLSALKKMEIHPHTHTHRSMVQTQKSISPSPPQSTTGAFVSFSSISWLLSTKDNGNTHPKTLTAEWCRASSTSLASFIKCSSLRIYRNLSKCSLPVALMLKNLHTHTLLAVTGKSTHQRYGLMRGR